MTIVRSTTEGSAVPESITVQPFAVISGAQVQDALRGREHQIVELVEATYRLHSAGESVNPPSYFLRFPDRPSSRIIALPASIGGDVGVDGLKWISSFPENVASGIPRASAGLIARYVHTFLAGTGWSFDEVGVHDLSADSATGFCRYLDRSGAGGLITVHGRPEDLIRSSDIVVFATVAGRPHVTDPSWFEHNPLVLHVSLRDLAPEIILGSTNIVDDVEHCLKADTSTHLAEQLTGNRDFVHGTLDDVMADRVAVPAGRPVVFSPFGLGVLDLAIGKYVYDRVAANGGLPAAWRFFHDLG